MKAELGIEQIILERIEESIATKRLLQRDTDLLATLAEVAFLTAESLRNDGTVFFFGNGGSAADAQHLAAELAGRYLLDRRPLCAIALSTNTSTLTAIGNDYGYEHLFERQLEALGSRGDVAIGISTSGNSENVVRAIDTARSKHLITVGMTGANGGKLREAADYCLQVPSEQTPRIQEAHITIGHILCEIIEQHLCG